MERSNEVKFEIVNNIGTISTSKSGWKKELNRVSWNGGEPKYDLREWDPEHTKMGKGVTLTEKELRELAKVLAEEVKFLDED